MERLLTFDAKNYTDDMRLYEKTTVRAIIQRGGKLAMQRSRTGVYKVPGGGIEPGETNLETLQREVLEETGLTILPDTVKPLGEVLELRQDIFTPDVKYVCHTLYYSCDVGDTIAPLRLTPSEERLGFRLAWAELNTIIRNNENAPKKGYPSKDTEFLKLIANGTVSLT